MNGQIPVQPTGQTKANWATPELKKLEALDTQSGPFFEGGDGAQETSTANDASF